MQQMVLPFNTKPQMVLHMVWLGSGPYNCTLNCVTGVYAIKPDARDGMTRVCAIQLGATNGLAGVFAIHWVQ